MQARHEADVSRLLDLRRYAEAETSARALLAAEPESASLHRMLATALVGLDRPAEAMRAARDACRLGPDDHANLLSLSSAAIAGGDSATAVAAARNAVALAPTSWATHYTLGRARLAEGRAGEALVALERAAELAPASPDVHNVRGLCLARLGRRAEAREAYRRALALDPQHALAINNLAGLDVLRNPVKAARGLTAAANADPQQRVVHRNLAIVTHNLVFQLRWVVLGGGLVEVALAYGGAPRWVRVVGLVLIAALVVGIAVQFARSLPRGARQSPRVLFSSMKGRTAVAIVYLAIAAMIVVEVALGPAEVRNSATRWLLQLLVIGAVVLGLQRRRRTAR